MRAVYFVILVSMSGFSGICQEKMDLCDQEKALLNLDGVQRNAKELLSSSNDECVLNFLDTLTTQFVRTRQTKFIRTLEAIRKVSDGYVSGYYMDLSLKFAFDSFGPFMEYLASQEADNCLEKDLVRRMSWKKKDGSSPNKDKFLKLMDESLNDELVKQRTKDYMRELREKLL